MIQKRLKTLRASLVETEGGPTVLSRNCLMCGNGCCQIHTVSLRSTVAIVSLKKNQSLAARTPEPVAHLEIHLLGGH